MEYGNNKCNTGNGTQYHQWDVTRSHNNGNGIPTTQQSGGTTTPNINNTEWQQ
jgi:hypothetical protein